MASISIWDVLLRLLTATACGGIIGIDRGRKKRPAGFRTYILVCVGATLTMLLGIYLSNMLHSPAWAGALTGEYVMLNTDVSRLGAQVINGIGFLGAGTIIVISGRQQVKGMTTAAGLWASACMGLAIGTSFYEAALIGCLLIVVAMVFFSKLEAWIMARARNVNYYIEFDHIDDLSVIAERVRSLEVRIFDVEINKKSGETKCPGAIFSLQLPKKLPHTTLLTALAELEPVRSIEEL